MGCGIDQKTLLVHVIFLDLLLFVSLLAKKSFVAQSTTEAEYVAVVSHPKISISECEPFSQKKFKFSK
jgi:hypothetical protein